MTEQEKRIEDMIYKVYLDNESGGALHIVIGDGNFEDNHIKYCLDCSIPNIENDEKRALYEECAKGLLSLKLSRRYSLASSAWNIYRKADEVRKEKAKEIYKAVLDLRELMVNNDDALCILRNVESWAKEDGVEVEE